MNLKPYPEYKDSGVEWIGKIPVEWQISRIKNHIESSKNGDWGSEKKNDENDMICIRVADFNYAKGNIYNKEYTIRNISSNKGDLILKKGNLLLEKSGGGEKQPVGRVVIFKNDFKAVCSNFVAKLRINEKDNSKYFFYLFNDMYSVKINTKSIKQTTGIQNLDSYSYFMEKIPAPMIEYQNQIVSFLDKKTSEIDKTIQKDTKLIELLKEKKTALINHVVTKGLDQNAKMKDSGVEWIGEIPEECELMKLKYFTSILGGFAFKSNDFSESGIQLIRIGNLYENKLDLRRKPIYLPEEYFEIYSQYQLKKGDIIISMTGTVNKEDYGYSVQIDSSKKFLMNQRVGKFIVNNSKINIKYFKYIIESKLFLNYVYSLPAGSKQANLSPENILNINVIIFPLEKQSKIVDYLDQIINKINLTIDKIKYKINLMEEYKKSLIHHVVTGKVDVRGVNH